MNRAIVLLAGLAPWFTILPLEGVARVLAHALTLIAAFHGAGQLLGAVAGRERTHPLLAVQWGIALLVALSGIAIALRVDRLAFQVALVCAMAAGHTIYVILRFRVLTDRVAALRDRRWAWAIPTVLLVILGAVHVLGAAGDLGARPFDDDGHVLAQLQRLRDTGFLGDGIGYPLRSQLGGQLALTALATAPGDVHLARMLEAIAFVLAFGLLLMQLRVRDPIGALWGLLLVIVASALTMIAVDPVTCWTAVGLSLALHAMLADRSALVGRGMIPLAVVAGAMIALRFELAPLAAVAAIVAWWPSRRDRRTTATTVAGIAVVVAPYLIARAVLQHDIAAEASRMLAPRTPATSLMVMTFVGVLAACVPLAIWSSRIERLRWYGFAAAATIAGIVSQLTGLRAYGLRFLWPVAIAGGLIVVIELVRGARLLLPAMIMALVAAALIHDGRTGTGRARWARRYIDLAESIEYLRHTGGLAPVTGGYDAAIALARADARIATWVTRPERLDYGTNHSFVDLRTPVLARFRIHRWDHHVNRLERLAIAAGADYLLLEVDDRRMDRIQSDLMYRFVCATHRPACADDLEVLAERHRVVLDADGVRLIDLRR